MSIFSDVFGVFTYMASVKDRRTLSFKKAKLLFTRTSLIISLGLMTALMNKASASAQSIEFENEELKIAQVNNYVSQRSFSLSVIWRYAAALQEINPIREEHNRQINIILGKNRPNKVCYHEPIPNSVQQSCKLFGAKMFQILRKHDVDDIYTPISLQVQSDANLRKKIQKAGVCQQRGISLNKCF